MEHSPESIATELTGRLALLEALRAHGNLTVAAAAIGIPQPTASRWLVALTELTGAQLTVRSGRKIMLTRAGAALAEAATEAMAVMRAGAARAIEAANPEYGHVVFGFLHTMGSVRVPALLHGFRAAHPGVTFTLLHASHEELLASTRAGTVDIALTYTSRGAGLRSVPHYVDELVLTVIDSHRLASRKRIRIAACAREVFVGFKPDYGIRGVTDTMCADAGFTPHPAFEGDDVATVRGLVAAGIGIAVLPAREGGPLPGTAELPLVPRAHREISLVTSADRPLPPAADSFHTWANTQSQHFL